MDNVILNDDEQIELLFEKIINYQNSNDDYSAIEIIYGTIFEFLLFKDFEVVGKILKKANECELTLANLIGFLTSTNKCDKEVAFERKALIEKTVNKIKIECPEDEEELMRGLY